ncbi:MAG TPA: hypothetical protein VD963_08575 [Phycisphaerales bacterium]|nr:hypothetical protein [Phycisphaerales bacterium]
MDQRLPQPPGPPDAGARLRRLEEQAAFAEHAADQAALEVSALARRLVDLERRLAVLESHLGRLVDPGPDQAEG